MLWLLRWARLSLPQFQFVESLEPMYHPPNTNVETLFKEYCKRDSNPISLLALNEVPVSAPEFPLINNNLAMLRIWENK